MKKQKKYPLVVLPGLILGIAFLSGCSFNPADYESYERFIDKSYPAEGVHSVEIYGASIDFQLLPSTDGQFRVYESYEAKGIHTQITPCSVEISDGVFRLQENSTAVMMGRMKHEIAIYLPDTEWKEYTAHLGSGSITGEDMTASKITLEVDSGKVRLGSLTADASDLRIRSGELTVKNMTTSQLEAEIHSGNLELEAAALPESIHLVMGSGTAKFRLPEESEFSVDYRISSGDIHSDFGHHFDETSGQTGTGGPVYQMEISSGSMTFTK